MTVIEFPCGHRTKLDDERPSVEALAEKAKIGRSLACIACLEELSFRDKKLTAHIEHCRDLVKAYQDIFDKYDGNGFNPAVEQAYEKANNALQAGKVVAQEFLDWVHKIHIKKSDAISYLGHKVDIDYFNRRFGYSDESE